MPRSALSRRSSIEWSVRGAIAIIAAAFGYYSLILTLGFVLKDDPKRAYVLAPYDARVAAHRSLLSFTEARAGRDRATAATIARDALKRDATAVQAIVTLGLEAQLKGNQAVARQLFSYSSQLSRRDLQSQLWSIEDSVGRDDIPGALRHYDIALRTAKSAPDLLFPVLSSAISDDSIRNALVKTLSAKPNWSDAFVDYVAVSGPNPRATAQFLQASRARGILVSAGADDAIVRALVRGVFLDDAWSYYRSIYPAAKRNWSRNPDFSADIDVPSLFDWRPINEAGVTATIQRDTNGGFFEFSAPPSVGGPALQQLLLLQEGVYRISGHSSEIEQSPRSRPYWSLICKDGRELNRVPVPNSAENGGRFLGEFSVPPDCPAQTLALMIRPSDSIAGTSGRIEQIQLAPAFKTSGR